MTMRIILPETIVFNRIHQCAPFQILFGTDIALTSRNNTTIISWREYEQGKNIKKEHVIPFSIKIVSAVIQLKISRKTSS